MVVERPDEGIAIAILGCGHRSFRLDNGVDAADCAIVRELDLVYDASCHRGYIPR